MTDKSLLHRLKRVGCWLRRGHRCDVLNNGDMFFCQRCGTKVYR